MDHRLLFPTDPHGVLVKHFFDYYNCYEDHAVRRADNVIHALDCAGYKIVKKDDGENKE